MKIMVGTSEGGEINVTFPEQVSRIEIDIKDVTPCDIRYIFQQIHFDLSGKGINTEVQ